jgi:hypothetical protein
MYGRSNKSGFVRTQVRKGYCYCNEQYVKKATKQQRKKNKAAKQSNKVTKQQSQAKDKSKRSSVIQDSSRPHPNPNST